MALNIKNKETEDLAAEVASLTGESKTGAVRQALRERRARLELARGEGRGRSGDLSRFLEAEIWPQVPERLLDRPPMTKAEREELLGYGPEGH